MPEVLKNSMYRCIALQVVALAPVLVLSVAKYKKSVHGPYVTQPTILPLPLWYKSFCLPPSQRM